MSTSILTSVLQNNDVLNSSTSVQAWVADQELRGAKVKRYRDYYDGNHDAKLTTEMRELLRITSAESDAPFNNNYCPLIVDSEVDRLKLEAVEADNDPASDWAKDILKQNRVDGLQLSLHEAAVRDADTFVLIDWDNKNQRVRLTHEPAYDGTVGMLVYYRTLGDREPAFAIKIWHITTQGGSLADVMRVNVYYPDRIERFISNQGATSLSPFEGDNDQADAPGVQAWTVGRVPVVHFRNKAIRHDHYGRSSIDDAIPLQDALNRSLHSMVATSELTGFPVRVAVGWTPQAGTSPGMWYLISPDTPIDKDAKVDWDVMDQGEITPFVQQSEFLIEQIATITNTPIPKTSGSATASGEALKQREIGLLGKVKRSQISFGNAWEDVLSVAGAVQKAFSPTQAPASESFNARWAPAELRNDTDLVDNALKVADKIPREEFLRIIAPVFGWDAQKVERLTDDLQSEQARTLQLSLPGQFLPGFEDNSFDPTQQTNGTTIQQEAA